MKVRIQENGTFWRNEMEDSVFVKIVFGFKHQIFCKNQHRHQGQ